MSNPKKFILTFFALLFITGIFFVLSDLKENETLKNMFIINPSYEKSLYNKTVITISDEDEKSLEEKVLSLYDQLALDLPAFPVKYLEKTQKKNSKNCKQKPRLDQLKTSNLIWQDVPHSNGTLFIYSAHRDHRKKNKQDLIRIIAASNNLFSEVGIKCLLWKADSEKPIETDMIRAKLLWLGKVKNPAMVVSYLLSCPYEDGVVAVSLYQEGHCNEPLENMLKVPEIDPNQNLTGFRVCVKGLNYPNVDMSYRLMEWLELMKALGADQVIFGQYTVHPKVTKMLKYYESTGFVRIRQFELPGSQPNQGLLRKLYVGSHQFQHWLNEVLPSNDCLYLNLHETKFIALIDIDEVIMPTEGRNWHELTNLLEEKQPESTSYCFRSVFYLDNSTNSNLVDPKYHILTHLNRSADYFPPGSVIKCFHKTDSVDSLHSHYPFGCIGGNCRNHNVKTDFGHVSHYRSGCYPHGNKDDCKKYVSNLTRDDAVLKYKEFIVRNMTLLEKRLGWID